MAGQSEKKRTQNATSTYQLYTQIIVALYVVYFLLRVVWCWSSFGFWTLLGFALFSALNFVCLHMVQQALELGTPVSGPQDVLFVNWAVMALSILTEKAYYLYLAVSRERASATNRRPACPACKQADPTTQQRSMQSKQAKQARKQKRKLAH